MRLLLPRILLMAAYCAIGAFSSGTAAAGNTVAVSGLVDGQTGTSFTPKVILFWGSGRTDTTDAAGNANHRRFFGAVVSTSSRFCVGATSVHNSAAASTANFHTNDCPVAEALVTPAIGGKLDLQSFDSGGFTLVVDVQFTADIRVQFLAIGGDVDGRIGTFTPAGAAPATQGVTVESGFVPTGVIFAWGAAGLGAIPTAGIDSLMGMGAMTGASGELVWTGGSNNGAATMQAQCYGRNGECIVRLNAAVTASQDRAEFSSFDADGFTINWLERAGAGTISYLALKGINIDIGSVTTQTDTTTPMTISGLSYAPAGVLMLSHRQPQTAADTPGDDDTWSMGAAVSTTQRCAMAVGDTDNAANATVCTAVEYDAIYARTNNTAITGLMDVTSFNGDGASFIMDDADPTQAWVGWMTFGPVATLAAGQPTIRRFGVAKYVASLAPKGHEGVEIMKTARAA